MRKLLLVLAFCLTICSKANAKDVVTGDDVANLMADYSVGEAYNIYLNRQKYPSTEKFLEMLLLAIFFLYAIAQILKVAQKRGAVRFPLIFSNDTLIKKRI